MTNIRILIQKRQVLLCLFRQIMKMWNSFLHHVGLTPCSMSVSSVASLSLSSPRNISLVCLSILFFTLDYVMFCFNYLMCHVKRSTLSVPWWPAVNTNSSLQTPGGANPSLLKWFLVFMMQILIKGCFQEVVYTVFSRLALCFPPLWNVPLEIWRELYAPMHRLFY